jgi:glycosyltransferase involved in cell wall biosynthesis
MCDPPLKRAGDLGGTLKMSDQMLRAITPILLTYNEAPNIERTIANLSWADEIIVVDSGSTDGTVDILRLDPRIRIYQRKFDSHRNQWRFATEETAIKTPWILRLDADYQVPPALVNEMAGLKPDCPENAFEIAFEYAVFSKKIVGSLYPPNTVLLRRGSFLVCDGGHTERWEAKEPIGRLKAKIVHDDWKAMAVWVESQVKYMSRELDAPPYRRRGLRDWLRRHPPLMPIATFFYCLVGKGLIFGGREGILYTLQRTVAEAIFALLLLERECRKSSKR